MQMPENHQDRENENLEAPPGLIAALKRSQKSPIFIPPTVDEAILRSARRHLTGQSQRQFRWPLFFRWSVATALAVAFLLVVAPRFARKSGLTPDAVFVRGDLNHDGQVDILDAFALARELKLGMPRNLQLDINGDGIVDERDLATLSARAVSLEKGSRL
jgi:hypothetical protein